MRILRSVHVVTMLSFVACSSSSKKTPDAKVFMDAPPPDARACIATTPGALDILSYTPGTGTMAFGSWGAPLTGNLGDGNKLVYQFEVYGGIEASLMGMFDLSAGNQSNYKTCAICVRAFDVDSTGNTVKQFFQSGGSITLTEDPLAAGHLVGSLTNLELQEVTVDPNNMFTSTPVVGGQCTDLGSYAVDHDKVPNAWSCTKAAYQDGTTCDCVCGAVDPDCDLKNPPVAGCASAATPACFDNMCVAKPLNDTCTLATPLTLATPMTGTTIGAAQDYDLGLEGAGCTGFAQPGPDVVYSIAMTAATQYTVTLSALDMNYDGSISLVGPGDASLCTAAITTCVKGADAMGPGGNETFTYTPATTGTYFVIVDSSINTQVSPFGNYAGAFTLTVTSP